MAPEAPKKRIGDILVESKIITATQLHEALEYGKSKGVKIGEALRELGFVNEITVAKALSQQLKLPYVDLDKIVVDQKLAVSIPELVCRKNKVLALGKRPGEVLVAFADPLNIFAVDELRKHVRDKIVTCVAVESKVVEAIDRYFSQKLVDESKEESRPTGSTESAAVAAVNDLLLQAVREETSDIHIEPGAEKMRVRFRVDGMLRQVKEFPMEMHPGVVSRIKILSQLDIGERRKPQDGRFEMPVSGKDFDFRISTLPLKAGEKVVMRLLDKSKIKIDLQDLGIDKHELDIITDHLSHPHEIALVTGPTGSGKTTTLYAALNHINSVGKNIVTVEDPVEYDLEGVNQVHVNPKANLTFASALRSILRQDPDVIMIGEIRDGETAEIAIQSALTGHLVLSTLHTNDSCGAITRLMDMGMLPFLIASSLGMVVAQRLVRKLCEQCKEQFDPPGQLLEDIGFEDDREYTFYKANGCALCEQTGFKGRIGIYEVLKITNEIEKLIMTKTSSHDILEQAKKEGLVTLRQSGINKMLDGITTLDEVMRVSLDTKG